MKGLNKNLICSILAFFCVFILVSCRTTHKHSVNEESWVRDSASHWHACEGCDSLIDLSVHTYGAYTKDEKECKQTRSCTVCGFVQTSTVDHTWGAWATRTDGTFGKECSHCHAVEYLTQYYVKGSMNGWSDSDDYKLVIDASTMTASVTVTLEAGAEFKVANSDWGKQFNATSITAAEGLFGGTDNIVVSTSGEYTFVVSGLDGEHKCTATLNASAEPTPTPAPITPPTGGGDVPTQGEEIDKTVSLDLSKLYTDAQATSGLSIEDKMKISGITSSQIQELGITGEVTVRTKSSSDNSSFSGIELAGSSTGSINYTALGRSKITITLTVKSNGSKNLSVFGVSVNGNFVEADTLATTLLCTGYVGSANNADYNPENCVAGVLYSYEEAPTVNCKAGSTQATADGITTENLYAVFSSSEAVTISYSISVSKGDVVTICAPQSVQGRGVRVTAVSINEKTEQGVQQPDGSEVATPNPDATFEYIYVSGLKTTYYLNEELDLTKLEVRAYYSDGTYVVLDEDEYIVNSTNVNKTAVGNYNVIISYLDDEETIVVSYKEKPTSDSGLGDITQGDITNVGDITITESAGHLEAAYIEWSPVENIESYHVYYKAKDASVMSYTKLDMMLIRKYNNYYRADIVGLAEGEYNIKVTSVYNNQEVGSFTEVTLAVGSHDRSGFAFSANSPLKDASGAYNSDGTLKNGAQVIYVHAGNAKTVSATVNGTQVKGFQAILDAKAKKNTSNDILCFRIIGTVSIGDLDGTSSSAIGLQVKGNSANTNMNITIEGIGEDATFNGFGILIRNCGNVEIRNLGFINFIDDGISVDTDNCNLWMHNNDFFYGSGGSGDKAKGDGSLDIKKSHYCTVSYNHFWDSGKCNLLDASTGSGSDHMSYHHNWFDHSDSRHPRVRNASSVHVYNNYFDGVAKYGIGAAGGGSSVFSEANYFRNTLHPYLISQQGTDISSDGKGTFSGEDGGIIKAYGDVIVGGIQVVTYQQNSTQFDVYQANERNEVISSSVKSLKGGYTYSNFDTSSTMYTYNVQTAEDAKETVMMYAGRINQGDLQYDFNDAVEDKNYDIIPELKSMVTNYKSSLVSILGASDYTGSTGGSSSGNNGGTTNPDDSNNEGGSGDNNQEVVEGAVVHNFTTQGKTSSVFEIEGNLSTSKGTVTYNGLTLTQCLKIESSTSIRFTINSDYTLILVFVESTSNIKINGDKETSTSNVLTKDLTAGTYTITKADTKNLFYIMLVPKE